MSSILKALKKVEAQSARSEQFFEMSEPVDNNREGKSPGRRRRLIRGWVAGLLLLLLLIFIAAVMFSDRKRLAIYERLPSVITAVFDRNEPKTSATDDRIFRAKIPPVPTRTMVAQKDSRHAQSRSGSTAVENQPDSPQAPLAARVSPSPKSAGIEPPSKAPEPAGGLRPEPMDVRETPPQKALDAGNTSAAVENPAAAKSMPAGKPAPRAKPQNAKTSKRSETSEKAETYDRIDASKLNLQALAWFNDPPRRMAVINSRIVREGESVDGYQVTQIRRQDVLVSDGSKKWRLEFSLKQ